MKKSREYDRHHLLPRNQGGNNNQDNIMIMPIVKHRALHVLFGGACPREQLDYITSMTTDILTEEVKRDMRRILENEDRDYWYKKHIRKY